jgi:hypothetical protein
VAGQGVSARLPHDGKLSQSKGVYPGALWGLFPPEPTI